MSANAAAAMPTCVLCDNAAKSGRVLCLPCEVDAGANYVFLTDADHGHITIARIRGPFGGEHVSGGYPDMPSARQALRELVGVT